MSASFKSETYTPDGLVAGNAHLLVGRKVTILSGQNIVRGTLLGKITTGGKYIKSLSGAADGSETPDAILAEDVDASAGDKEGLVYMRGDFVEEAVTFGTAHTANSVREGLRAKGITLIKRG